MSSSSPKRISDLLELRPVQTIIQLGEDKGKKEAIEAFVLTDDLHNILKDFCRRLPQDRGAGVFLKGHYGTGKSHLLAFIGEDAPKGFPVLSKLISSGSLPSFQVHSISLVQHPASRSLEDILMASFSAQDPQTFEVNERQSIHRKIIQGAQGQGHHGQIILLDELSEFLKSKPTPESLTEDLRYLQFLGELAEHLPLWLVGAIQEDLEGMGAATRETSLKLKDRFALRWNLSQLHLEEMLSQRLLLFKEGATDFLARLHQRCQTLWPAAFSRDGLLLSIYPLHPTTLDLLTHLGTLFSEHRGALRFVRDVLLGLGPNPPHLEREAHALIGPEQLFDYFSNRFEENLELQQYHRKAWVHLNQRVKDRLPPEDQDLALRALKVILLSSIDPRQEGINLILLGETLMLQRDSDPKKGQQDLKIAILDPILERCNYLKCTEGLYHIDLSHEGQSLLDELLAKRIENQSPLEKGGWLRILSLLDQNPLRLAPLLRQISPSVDVQWLNSTRTLQINFGLEKGPCDLRILFPGQVATPSDADTLIWEPLSPEDPSLWQEALALMEMIEAPAETAMEARAKEQALKRYRLERPRWQEKIENLYLEGHQLVGREPLHLQLDLARRLSLEAFLEPLAHEILSRRHPLFRTIAPKIPYYSEQSYVQLIEHLFLPGSIKDNEAQRLHLADALHGLALPMGLGEKKGSQFMALWDPERSQLVKTFMDTLEKAEDLKSTKNSLQLGPWGIPTGQLHFLIWAGVAMGHLIAYRDQEELPFEKLSLYNLGSIDDIHKRDALDPEILHRLSNHPFFNDSGLTYSGLTLQRKLWERAAHQIQPTRAWIEENEHLAKNFWKPQITIHDQHQQSLENILQKIDLLGNDSHQGLSWAHENLQELSSWLEASVWIKSFRRLDRNFGKDLDRLLVFMLDECLDHLSSENGTELLARGRTELLEEWESHSPNPMSLERVEDWQKGVESWCQSYRQAYKASHEKEQANRPRDLQDWVSRLQFKGFSLPPLNPACDRPLERELQFKAECRCGHQLGKQKLFELDSWSSHLIESLKPIFHQHNDFAQLSQLCQDKAFSEANQLWQKMDKDIDPAQDNPPKEISLDALLGKGQVMNRKTILNEIESRLSGDLKQLYRIEN